MTEPIVSAENSVMMTLTNVNSVPKVPVTMSSEAQTAYRTIAPIGVPKVGCTRARLLKKTPSRAIA